MNESQKAQGQVKDDQVGNVYFYNMTNEKVHLTVNKFTLFIISAMPTSLPYTPNISSPGLTRVDTPSPDDNQFGNTNTVTYQLSGTVQVTVNINVDFSAYRISYDILIYLFYDAVVVTVLSDNRAYFGRNGDKINVALGNARQ